MSTFDAASRYFSGQGVVMLGSRDANGNPAGLRPVGNCSDLKITVATTVVEHKGSQDGQRAIDARLQTETKGTISMTIDNWIAANLSKALRGNVTPISAGTVTNEAVNGYAGLVTGFQYINVTGVTVTGPNGALTPFVNSTTAYDYQLNNNAGSVELNNGDVTPVATLGTVATAVTVGPNTIITVPNAAQIGDEVYFQGFGGAGGYLLNGNGGQVIAASGSAITVNINTVGATITVNAGSKAILAQPIPLTVSYGYGAQENVQALTQGLTDSWVRFEGLNTAEDNAPVIVDIFRFSNDPLKELALLSDTYGEFVIEGSMLNDNTKLVGSKYFSIRRT